MKNEHVTWMARRKKRKKGRKRQMKVLLRIIKRYKLLILWFANPELSRYTFQLRKRLTILVPTDETQEALKVNINLDVDSDHVRKIKLILRFRISVDLRLIMDYRTRCSKIWSFDAYFYFCSLSSVWEFILR